MRERVPRHDGRVAARVIVLAGPSGSGKWHLAERLELPILRLDDFYRDGADPLLPRITTGANAGLVDWDDPASWLCDEAVDALAALCRAGLRRDAGLLDLGQRPHRHPDAVPVRCLPRGGGGDLRAPRGRPASLGGLLAAAYCLRQHPMVTFWRRLSRDLREHRKPPLVLVRRGVALMRDQRRIVARPSLPAAPRSPRTRRSPWSRSSRCRGSSSERRRPPRPLPARPALLRAHFAGRRAHPLDPAYAATQNPHAFAATVQALHRQAHRCLAFGRAQPPWPRALGTPPWAVVRAMTEFSGIPYRNHIVRWGNREDVLRRPARPLSPPGTPARSTSAT